MTFFEYHIINPKRPCQERPRCTLFHGCRKTRDHVRYKEKEDSRGPEVQGVRGSSLIEKAPGSTLGTGDNGGQKKRDYSVESVTPRFHWRARRGSNPRPTDSKSFQFSFPYLPFSYISVDYADINCYYISQKFLEAHDKCGAIVGLVPRRLKWH